MDYRERTDAELVELAQRGDRVAFSELVRRHRGRSYAQCLKMMRDPEDAEDRVQDAFAKAYQALPGFRRDARFATWLYAIARNTCLMHMRRKSLPTISLDRPKVCENGDVEHDVPDPTADAEARVMRKELATVLSRHIDRLSPLNRVVFELRLVQGVSTEETALLLGLSVPAVKSRLHAVRVDLRAGLSTYLETGCCSV